MNRRTPNNPKNPAVPVVTDYIGLDAVIEALRAKLDTDLAWIDKAFHKVFTAVRRSDNPTGTDIIKYPVVWQGQNVDMLNVIMNDNLNAFLYFLTEGEKTVIDDYSAGGQNRFEKRVYLIIWANLDGVDRTKNYPYTEDLLSEVVESIAYTALPDGSGVELINVTESDSNPEDIFEPFTLNFEQSQYFRFPRYGFRIGLDVSYRDKCQAP